MRMSHIVICGSSGCTVFFSHYLIRAPFSKKKKVIEHKMYVVIFFVNFVWNISGFKKNSARYYHVRA
jgi:hypothetical protein